MIQDLNDYAVFGRKHQKLFDAIGYDKSTFDRAAQLSREMNELLPLATLDKSNSPERIRRNKAFCLTKNLIDELLAWAYIFHEDKNLASRFYTSTTQKAVKPKKKGNTGVDPVKESTYSERVLTGHLKTSIEGTRRSDKQRELVKTTKSENSSK